MWVKIVVVCYIALKIVFVAIIERVTKTSQWAVMATYFTIHHLKFEHKTDCFSMSEVTITFSQLVNAQVYAKSGTLSDGCGLEVGHFAPSTMFITDQCNNFITFTHHCD